MGGRKESTKGEGAEAVRAYSGGLWAKRLAMTSGAPFASASSRLRGTPPPPPPSSEVLQGEG